jgi:DNA-binding XRE family transcriptional regulator
MCDRFVRIASLLAEFGPQHVREPYVKPLGGKLWEMRMKGQGDRIAMRKLADLHKRWMEEPAYEEAHGASEAEFTLARELIAARVYAGLTQQQLAQAMDTTQSAIARLESGRRMPGVKTLERLAEATGTRLVVRFERAGEQTA